MAFIIDMTIHHSGAMQICTVTGMKILESVAGKLSKYSHKVVQYRNIEASRTMRLISPPSFQQNHGRSLIIIHNQWNQILDVPTKKNGFCIIWMYTTVYSVHLHPIFCGINFSCCSMIQLQKKKLIEIIQNHRNAKIWINAKAQHHLRVFNEIQWRSVNVSYRLLWTNISTTEHSGRSSLNGFFFLHRPYVTDVHTMQTRWIAGYFESNSIRKYINQCVEKDTY